MTQLSTANQMENSAMKTAAKLLACSVGLFAAAQLHAQTNVVSDPVGFYKIPIVAGANTFSVPLPKVHSYRGLIASVSGSNITFSGTPNLTAGAFAQATAGAEQRYQFMVLVKNDADQAGGASNNVTGDWWLVDNNTTNSVTVNTGGDTLTSILGTGDQLEIRKLTSAEDLFGSGPNYILNKDTLGSGDQVGFTDVIKTFVGTGFDDSIYYYEDGSPDSGYYLNGNLVGSNSVAAGKITFLPNASIVLYRKPGSPATNVVALGQVQTTKFTHYLAEGANAVGTPYPAAGQFQLSGLLESGWHRDSNAVGQVGFTDVIRQINSPDSSPSFGFGLYYYQDPNPVDTGWYDGTNVNSTITMDPSKGYMMFILPGSGGHRWRQTVPFTP